MRRHCCPPRCCRGVDANAARPCRGASQPPASTVWYSREARKVDVEDRWGGGGHVHTHVDDEQRDVYLGWQGNRIIPNGSAQNAFSDHSEWPVYSERCMVHVCKLHMTVP